MQKTSVLLPFIVWFTLFILLTISPMQAAPMGGDGQTLTGDWGGLRGKLEKKGISLEMLYTGEVYSILSGGTEKKTLYLDNKDIILGIDAEKLLGWRGAEFSVYMMGNHGGSPSEYIGDYHTVSNIDAPDMWRIYEAWYQQRLFDGRFSIRLGLYDLNSEFDVIESAGEFVNSSFGIGPDFSQSGENGPSVFPNAALGVRFRWEPGPGFYVQAVVLDGVPGSPANYDKTAVHLDADEGALVAGEMAWLDRRGGRFYTKVALGMWQYTSGTLHGGPPVTGVADRGFYVLAERQLLRAGGDASRGLFGFVRYGVAPEEYYQLDAYLGAGLVYKGPFAGREKDVLGLAVGYASNGRPYLERRWNRGVRAHAGETVIELIYRAEIFPWLVIKPDVQYLILGEPSQADRGSLGFALRTEVVL